MGGHGGLNILPQKRWNVYRRDNRAKVARDETQHYNRQEQKAKKRQATEFNEKIIALRTKTDNHEDNINNNNQESQFFDSTIHAEKKRKTTTTGHHLNLFDEEEKAFLATEAKHLKYLMEIGHTNTSVSDFDKVNSKQISKPWYLSTTTTSSLKDNNNNPSEEDQSILQYTTTSETNNLSIPSKKKNQKKSITQLRSERLERERKDREKRPIK